MTLPQLSAALVRLSEFKIGVQEAAMLTCLDEERTNHDIAVMTGFPRSLIWPVTASLRVKGLLRTQHRGRGDAVHRLTIKGLRMMERVLGND